MQPSVEILPERPHQGMVTEPRRLGFQGVVQDLQDLADGAA